MLTLINGWTKEKVMAQIKKYNDGTRSVNKMAPDNETYCSYQNAEDNRCFVGCFIPSDHKALTSGKDIIALMDEFPSLEDLMPFEIGELSLFQTVHDKSNKTHDGDTYKALEVFLNTRVK